MKELLSHLGFVLIESTIKKKILVKTYRKGEMILTWRPEKKTFELANICKGNENELLTKLKENGIIQKDF